MNPQNSPARIRAKRTLSNILIVLASAGDAIDSRNMTEKVGTLVDDIIQAAVDQMKNERAAAFNSSLDEALNMGDGSYKP